MYAILVLSVLLAIATPFVRAALFINKKTYMGPDFFQDFTWQTADDPTHGRVNFVDLQTAMVKNLTVASPNKFVMRVDSTTVVSNDARGRDSIRIISNDAYDDAIILIDLSHMPFGAATWPAFWTLSGEGPWPNGAEIDIIEGVNYDTQNLASLHTTSSCSMAEQRPQSGFTVSTNCDAAVNWNQGCGTRFAKANSYGAGFNSAGGGWFAMERSREDGVKVWFWSRLEDDVPRNIRDADALIDPSSFGMPSATFPKDSCDYDTHFNAHKMIFDTTLCGDWAGSEFSSTGILGGCDKYVDDTPDAFRDAYWEVNSLHVYSPLPDNFSGIVFPENIL
ncbi:2 beta-glucans in both donor and acceptor sites of Gh16 Laminarinase 16a [Pleurotus eryngii]|uniref:2 beta-glucans in both donor and acceptor sites of Gh16 Laminarinase 16a n=1 Tax=Pleurotus eryngii TaxID=5323 RepID=A0A9P6DEI0_PLEER|nr:2 beta-glucans in both donor and acceptor sites of Gh16 Laminarinase 16a [Pleurotus eryngii]